MRTRGWLMVALLAVPMTAAAQTERVSNLTADDDDGTYFGGGEVDQDTVAQGFTTGPHTDGYMLERIEVRIKQWPTDSGLVASLWGHASSNPNAILGAMSLLDSTSTATGIREFEPSSPITLDPSTSYYFALHNPSTGTDNEHRARVDTLEGDSETGETGWTIFNGGAGAKGAETGPRTLGR